MYIFETKCRPLSMYSSAAECSAARCSVSFSQEAQAASRAVLCSALHSASCTLAACAASSSAAKASLDDRWAPSALTSNRRAQLVLSIRKLQSDDVKLLCVGGSPLSDLWNAHCVGRLHLQFGLAKILCVGGSKLLRCLSHCLGHWRRVATTCVGALPIVFAVWTLLLPRPALSVS